MDVRSGSIGKWAGDDSSPLQPPQHDKGTETHGGRTRPRRAAAKDDSRERERHSAEGQRCRATYQGRPFDAEVVNLSGGGAMIAASFSPDVGEHLDLHLGEGGDIECVVRWVKPGRMGLEFAHETQLQCSDAERNALLRAVLKTAFKQTRPQPAPEPEKGSEHRIAKRHPLIWSAKLTNRSGSWQVRLRNISDTGALVQSTKPVPVGRPVLVDLGKAGTVHAVVSWAVGDHCGLRFDDRFDISRLSRSKPSVAPSNWVRPAYLSRSAPDNAAWDKAWSRLSVEELKMQLEGFMKH